MRIDPLRSDEVFVFGSNTRGFHGAGAAGFACRGDALNTWRRDAWFLRAMKSPVGSPERVGKWAVFGVGRGFQRGREGMSYAIETVKRPGARRSTTPLEIYDQLVELWAFARAHPEWTFLVTPLGEGYSGYTRTEMDEVWECLKARYGKRANVRFVGRDDGVQAT